MKAVKSLVFALVVLSLNGANASSEKSLNCINGEKYLFLQVTDNGTVLSAQWENPDWATSIETVNTQNVTYDSVQGEATLKVGDSNKDGTYGGPNCKL